ncbi:MAG: hypothetical protein Kow0074_19150 [Candidatus Zixiibacteriota bacterium]
MNRPDNRQAPRRDDDTGRRLRQIGVLTAIPFVLMFGPLIGYYAGSWLDAKIGTDPYLTNLLVVLGFVAAGREVWNLIRRASGGPDQ